MRPESGRWGGPGILWCVVEPMGRHYRNRYRSSRDWSAYHASKHSELRRRYGGIIAEVQTEFLAFRGRQLVGLLDEYERRHGASARCYAEDTLKKWRSRSVQMSGQTAERLLDLVPPFLSPDRRFDLVTKLRAHYLRPAREQVRCDLDNWEQEVGAAVERVVGKSRALGFPADVMEGATWLASEDAKAAQELLARAEEIEARNRVAYLQAEFQRLRHMVSLLDARASASVSHEINLPQGNIGIVVEKGRGSTTPPRPNIRGPLMTSTNDGPGGRGAGDSLAPIPPRPQNLIDLATHGMTEQEVQAIRSKALEVRVDLDKQRVEADDRFQNSTRDMATTLKLVEGLERTGQSDYELKADYKSASGTTTVRVSRATNKTIIVIAVAVAIILVLVLLKN